MDPIVNMYEKYGSELREVWDEMQPLYYKMGGPTRWQWNWYRVAHFALRKIANYPTVTRNRPATCDIELEILYMRLRETKPKMVIDLGCGVGWATVWILKALKMNDKGHCFSYDLIDPAIENIPMDLQRRWDFVQGCAEHSDYPPEIDYLHIDCEHTQSFAYWYTEELFPRVKGHVSIHDIFNRPEVHTGESDIIKAWLKGFKVDHFSPSPFYDAGFYLDIVKYRKALGLPNVHPDKDNMMVFFEMPKKESYTTPYNDPKKHVQLLKDVGEMLNESDKKEKVSK